MLILVSRIVDNAIPATAFKAIKAARKPGEREENETEKGLRVQDKGFLNTAVMSSTITYIDGDAGGSFTVLTSRSQSLTCSSGVQYSDTGSSFSPSSYPAVDRTCQ